MKERIIIIFTMFFITPYVKAQEENRKLINDSIIITSEDSLSMEQIKLKAQQGTLSDREFALKNADTDYEKSNYSFHSGEFYPPYCTYCDVLRIDYNIMWYFTTNLFTEEYYRCYDSIMTVKLKEKFGYDFLDRAEKKADSLDRTGYWRKDPSFVGGVSELLKYEEFVSKKINSSITGPISKGRIYVTFIIDTSGAITDVKNLKGINEEIDKKAIDLVKNMPKWNPAYDQGKPIRCGYNIQIKVGIE